MYTMLNKDEPDDPFENAIFAKLLTDLIKIYNKDWKYGGDEYDVLDSKL